VLLIPEKPIDPKFFIVQLPDHPIRTGSFGPTRNSALKCVHNSVPRIREIVHFEEMVNPWWKGILFFKKKRKLSLRRDPLESSPEIEIERYGLPRGPDCLLECEFFIEVYGTVL